MVQPHALDVRARPPFYPVINLFSWLIGFVLAGALPVAMFFASRASVVILFMSLVGASFIALLAYPPRIIVQRLRATFLYPVTLVLVLTLLWMGISVLWAPDQADALKRLTRVFGTFAMFVVLFSFRSLYYRRSLLALTALTILVSSTLFLLDISGLTELRTLFTPRVESQHLFALNRALVTVSLMLWPALLGLALLALHGKPEIRSLYWLWAGIALTYALFVFLRGPSQTALLGMIVGASVWILLRLLPRIGFYGLTGASMALVLVAPWLMPRMQSLISWVLPQSLDKLIREAHLAERIDIWSDYGTLIMERGLQGYGLAASRTFGDGRLLSTLPAAIQEQLQASTHPHSLLLEVWVDLGLIGALLLVALIGVIARTLLGYEPRIRAYLGALFFATLAVAAISHGAFQSWWLAVLVALCCMSPARVDAIPWPWAIDMSKKDTT